MRTILIYSSVIASAVNPKLRSRIMYLDEAPIGQPLTIKSATGREAIHRLVLLNLTEGCAVNVLGDAVNGEIQLKVAGRCLLIPGRLAHQILVERQT